MKIHSLKSWPEYFQPVRSGQKRAEVRMNDRKFEAGDQLALCEWNPETKSYTGQQEHRMITLVEELSALDDGYVLLHLDVIR